MGIVNASDNIAYVADYLRSNYEMQSIMGLEYEIKNEDIHFLGHGEHNRNFWVLAHDGFRYVVRINVIAQPFHDDQVAYEYSALKYLRQCGCVPRAIYLDNSHELIDEGALIISYCEGQELDFDNLRPGDLRCAVQMMANYHAVPVGEDCPLHRPKDPLRDLFNECLDRFEAYRSSDVEDPRITRWAERFISAAQDMLDTPYDPSEGNHVINTEPLPSHFLIPEASAISAANAGDGGIFTATPGRFVDWERPIIGEVAQDLAYFTAPTTTYWDSEFLMGADQAAEVVEDYWRAVDGRFERGSFDARYKAYRAMTALRSTTWCCKALLSYRPDAQTHTTSKTAEKLPIYLSDDFMERIAKECFEL